jgi:acyl-lipid omega-6 desaturase (Delta-12 desaturase)
VSDVSQDSPLAHTERQINPMVWKAVVAKYQQPSLWRSIFQIVDSVVPYAALWFLMDKCLALSGWLIVPLAILAGGFLARIFIIHHDCGHGSFFKSRTANDVVGFITGVLTFTPYHFWRFEHAVHHAGSGDLDRCDLSPVWTMTVQEYLGAPWWRRFASRVMRNPVILLGVVPSFLFLVYHRFASSRASRRDRYSVYWTNAAMVALGILLSLVMGLKAYLVIQLYIMMVASTVGVWLFYVQHQFEGVNWQRYGTWDYATAALEGSSFY